MSKYTSKLLFVKAEVGNREVDVAVFSVVTVSLVLTLVKFD